jgi:3-deoxy-manno-octulosonate cytidylyltransferase (CMP-KDO synthetase)
MRAHIVVPARLASTRLPNKPIADIAGKPMIVRVMERVAEVVCDTIVAAVDAQSVFDVVTEAGFAAIMTDPDHLSGSDRVKEVATLSGWSDDDIVINVQGDEPLLPPALVQRLIDVMKNGHDLATVSEPIETIEDFNDPNIVKVVTGFDGQALYFSRSPIPFTRDPTTDNFVLKHARRHVGIYAFRVSALRDFTEITNARLENTEKLEQLRWLEAGRSIYVVEASEPVPGGVDTAVDLERVRALFTDKDADH